MTISQFQEAIERIYLARDRARGAAGTFVWFVEEVGELARATQRGTDRANLEEEFADCLAWLCTLASLHGIRMEDAARKYAGGCPVCRAAPCACPTKR